MNAFKTADLCDDYSEQLQIAEPLFGDFGGHDSFAGPISTLKIFEDNSLVRAALQEVGEGRVLVVDGGGSMRCALLGDQLGELAVKNGWSGIVVYGAIRDTADILELPLGVKALGAHPLKSAKRNEGQRELSVHFASVNFVPGHYLYADSDGIVLASERLG